jgi:predicted DNA-binding transcriptional regulator YafY
MLRIETGTERLVRAVLEHRTVRFTYHGLQRVVEPHMIGIHEAGEPLLVGYQTAGSSGSGEVPGWRTFVTTQIEQVETGDAFPGPRPDFSAEAHAMVEIFARA